jgi:nucleoside-diphosphate-sugar epimerase
VLTEDDALDPDPPRPFVNLVAALRHLERAVTGAAWTTGIVLRYGGFYGPGTTVSLRPPGSQSELVRKRMFPIIGDGSGIWSFIHVEDAAQATVAAIDRAQRGIYQITDDEPAAVRDWLPGLAAALGAGPPLRVPEWLGRLAAGEPAVIMMTEVSGASNAKARRELGWAPRYASWREGFRHGLD